VRGGQECSFLGECLLPSFLQEMDKRLPQFVYGETTLVVYLFGCSFICFASSVIEVFIIVLFIYLFIYLFICFYIT